jgi:hypothetical protein
MGAPIPVFATSSTYPGIPHNPLSRSFLNMKYSYTYVNGIPHYDFSDDVEEPVTEVPTSKHQTPDRASKSPDITPITTTRTTSASRTPPARASSSPSRTNIDRPIKVGVALRVIRAGLQGIDKGELCRTVSVSTWRPWEDSPLMS